MEQYIPYSLIYDLFSRNLKTYLYTFICTLDFTRIFFCSNRCMHDGIRTIKTIVIDRLVMEIQKNAVVHVI